jgi:uncharacterized protein YggE
VKISLLVPVLALALAALPLQGCGGEGDIVAVSGVGTVRVRPDTVRMTLSLRHTAETTREAQQEVTGMVRQALEVLRLAGVEDRNIVTTSLRFSPEYDWRPQGRVFLGQKAEQVLNFSILDSGDDGAASEIIDRLIGIDGIELTGMLFTVGETTGFNKKARELAYLDALEKARQFAELSGRRIVRAAGIFEDGVSPSPARQMAARAPSPAMFAMADSESATGTALPSGETEITARISVEFLIR